MENFKKKLQISLILIAVSFSIGLGTNAVVKTQVKAPAAKTTIQNAPAKPTNYGSVVYEQVNALDVAANPQKYLNKHIKIKAQFDKFATLGLDYKPAYRSSEKYISFLIKRDDVKDHTIPLSEMKIFIKRDEAEKHIDLNSGDLIEFSGYVFSTALGDPWVEVEKFTVLNHKPSDKK